MWAVLTLPSHWQTRTSACPALAGSAYKAPHLRITFQGSRRWPYPDLTDEEGGLKQVVCLQDPESRPAQNQWSLVALTPTLAPAWFISHQPSLRSQSSKWFPLMAWCPSSNLLTLSSASTSARSLLFSSWGRRERESISPVIFSLSLSLSRSLFFSVFIIVQALLYIMTA